MIEDVFGCRLFACYGHSEKLVAAAPCEYAPTYHVWPTYGYCELLDAAGRPVTEPGARGEIVGTGFINSVVPFIRYRTGDWATYVDDHCEKCGRAHLLLKDIEGHRTQEVVVTAEGSLISWTALNMHDDTFDGLRQYQLRQEVAGKAVLRIVPAPEFNEISERRMRRRLEQKFAGQVALTLERCEEIVLSPRGKAIYIDQRIEGLDQLLERQTGDGETAEEGGSQEVRSCT